MKNFYTLFFAILLLVLLPSKVFAQAPVITSFTPLSAKPGDVVTITGVNFNSTSTNNIVFFGDTRATVTAATATSVTVTVPTGASYAPINLLNSGTNLMACSLKNFIPSYSPAKTGIASGDFLPKQDFAGPESSSLATGDLDGDGKPDLAVVNYNSNTISVYRNTSVIGSINSGSFAAKVDFITASTPRTVTIGDLDGDGKPELVVNCIEYISIYHNVSSVGSIGAASFEPKVDFASLITYALAIGDFDGDGKPDLAAVGYDFSEKFSVYRNTGTVGSITSGSFAPKVDFVIPASGTPHNIAIGDLDGDGKLDLVITNYFYYTFSVFRNTSSINSITSGSFAPGVHFDTRAYPTSVAIGDLDGDGKPDITIGDNSPGSLHRISVFQNISNTGDITLSSFATPVEFDTYGGNFDIKIGDLDGDGKPDLIAMGSKLSVLRNTANIGSINSGSFAAKVDFVSVLNSKSLAIIDIDGDGKPDLTTANYDANNISVLRNTSNNADLSALTISAGTISPTFISANAAYTASVNNATTSITVIPTKSDPNANIKVRVNGGVYTTINSGVASSALSLNVGNNIIDVQVTAQDGTTIKTYTITVTRISINADLSALTTTAGVITPTFAAATTLYSVTVPNAITSIAVTATKSDSSATMGVRINGGSYTTLSSGTASIALFLNVGTNTIDVQVIAQDGTTIKTYTITVTRFSINADLSALSTTAGIITPTFATATTGYAATVPNLTTSITVTATKSDAGANIKVRVNGGSYATINSGTASAALSLNPGSNTIDLQVTAQDETMVKIYTITVIRVPIPPTITSFTPQGARPGDAINITGSAFNTVTTKNIVFFGATKANVTAATATSLTVSVPTGATYAPITVLNTDTGLAAYSLINFIPTYSPAKTTITSNDFSPKVDFTTGTNARSVAIGDLDGDGKPDLAVVNNGSNTISVYRNTATSGSISQGSFAAKQDFATGLAPISIAIGDLDGDGRPDLAVANNGSNTVSVYRNTGTPGSINSGSFAAHQDFTTGSGAYSVAIGDLDGDGRLDLAVTNFGSNTVSVYRNTAVGGSIDSDSFAAKQDFTTDSGPVSLAIGDLDGDGKPDLAVTNYSSDTVSIYRNTATQKIIDSASFAAGQDYTTGSTPISVAIGDLDGDGSPDLAVVNYNSASVSLYRNMATSGSINSGSFAAREDFTTGSGPSSIAIGDLSGDGKPDLAVANQFSNTVSVLRNTSTSGNIGLGSFAAKQDFTTDVNPGWVAVADLDGDARPDLALSNSNSTVSIIRNVSNNANLSALATTAGALAPTFTAATIAYTVNVTNPTASVTVTPTKSDGEIQVRVNGGSYTTIYSGAASNALPLNAGSNIIDLQVTAEDGTTVKIYTITIIRAPFPPTITSFAPQSAKPGDAVTITGTAFNMTTTNNIVFFGATRATVTAATTTSLTVTVPTGATYAPITILNTGSGLAAYSLINFIPTYSPEKTAITSNNFLPKVDFATNTSPRLIAIGDLDGDGRPDLAVVTSASNTLSIYRNIATSGSISTASFAAKVDFATGSTPYSVAIGDLDGDGKPDIAVANNGSNRVSVFRNTSTSGIIHSGSFEPKQDFITGSAPRSVAIGDLDGNGKLDLAVVNNGSNTVSVFRNTAINGSINSGSFAARQDFTTGTAPVSVAIGDLDGDGKPDLAVTNNGSNTVSVYRNTASPGSMDSGSFAAKQDFSTGSTPLGVAIGDLDGDGKPDLAVVDSGSDTVSLYRNTAISGIINASSFAFRRDFTTATAPRTVAIGDLDGNGKPDLAVSNFNSAVVSVYRNTSTSGSINSGSFANKQDFTTGSGCNSVAIADMDGDGKPDLAATNFSSNSVSVLRNTSNNADLSALTTTAGTLNPAFASTTTAYTASVNNATTNITVTPTKSDVNATITVNGTTVISGNPSNTINLNEGSNIITIIVTAQNTSAKTYTLTVCRAVLPTFTPVASICQGDVFVLPTVSNNGITGTWSPALNDMATTVYTFMPNVGQCAVSTTMTITIGGTTTWTGSSWNNGTPTSISKAVIAANYTEAANITACTLEITGNTVVTIPSGTNLEISGKLTVAPTANVTFENNANLLQTRNVANSGIIKSKRSTAMVRQDYVYWSSPVTGQNLHDFSSGTLPTRFYTLDEAANNFATIDPQTNDFIPAKGFMIRAPNNFLNPPALPQPWTGTFTGVPNNGTVTTPITHNGQGYNLIGNPYPSSINAGLFLAQNPGTLYYWTHRSQAAGNGANYASYNATGGTAAISGGNAPDGTITSGQGFVLLAVVNGTATFENSMRVGNNNGVFYRDANEKHRIWLNLDSPTSGLNQMLIGYIDGATMGADIGMDGKMIEGGSSISSIINDNNYVIQARPLPFSDTDVVPLNFRAEIEGMYIISIDHVDGLFADDQEIYLKDNLMDITYDIKQNVYEFASTAGNFANRFEILYQNATLGTSNPEQFGNQIVIYKEQGIVKINSGKIIIANVKVFDIRGRLIYEKDSIDANEIPLEGLDAENQVLLVQITGNDGQMATKKMVK